MLLERDRKRLVQQLSALPDKHFAELIHDVVSQRNRTSDTEAERGHFVLATATLNIEDRSWELETVAAPNPVEYPAPFDGDAPLCQFGTCGDCDHSVVSWAKRAICSVCGKDVYCT